MDELREMMEAAYDEAESAANQEAEEQAEMDFGEAQQREPAQEESAALGDELPEKKEPESSSDSKSSREWNEAVVPDADSTTESIDQKTVKAPASWSAKARETWAKLPPEAQAEVNKREGEINRVLQESASARRAVQELNQVLQPHAQRLMSSGVQSPIQAIGTLLATEGQLRQGDTGTKAQTIARLIREYGVDIEALDNVLSGQGIPHSPSSQPDIDAILEKKLAPFQQYLTQQQQFARTQAERSMAEANRSVSDFSQNAEFINDVRLDMADLMDMAASRGQNLTLEEAYNKACVMHPEVSKILADRERQKAMMGQDQAAKAKRNAAVSITGEQGGGGSSPEATSLRAQISQAWADSMQNS